MDGAGWAMHEDGTGEGYYDQETPKSVYPEMVSGFVAWKLMLRLLWK